MGTCSGTLSLVIRRCASEEAGCSSSIIQVGFTDQCISQLRSCSRIFLVAFAAVRAQEVDAIAQAHNLPFRVALPNAACREVQKIRRDRLRKDRAERARSWQTK